MSFRVLLVDDNQDFLRAARRLLEAEGLTVVGTATSSADAVSLIHSLQPDLALVDIKLGGESGIELSSGLIEASAERDLRVLLISTHAEEDFRDLIEASPAAGFVAKSGISAAAIRRALDERSS